MKPKHSPGPWTAGFSDGSGQSSVISKQGRRVAETNPGCGCCADSEVSEEQKANARLMAAAPEMLDFIKQFDSDRYCDADQINGDHSTPCWACNARSLIAKAEGQE